MRAAETAGSGMEPGSSTGNPCRSPVFVTVKIAVFAPVPGPGESRARAGITQVVEHVRELNGPSA